MFSPWDITIRTTEKYDADHVHFIPITLKKENRIDGECDEEKERNKQEI